MDLVGSRFSKNKFLSSLHFPGIRPDRVFCVETLGRALLSRFSQTRDFSVETLVSEHSRVSIQEDQMPTFTFQLSLASSLRRKGGDSGVVTCVRS